MYGDHAAFSRPSAAPGITYREYLAAEIVKGFSRTFLTQTPDPALVATKVVELVDQILAELEKQGTKT